MGIHSTSVCIFHPFDVAFHFAESTSALTSKELSPKSKSNVVPSLNHVLHCNLSKKQDKQSKISWFITIYFYFKTKMIFCYVNFQKFDWNMVKCLFCVQIKQDNSSIKKDSFTTSWIVSRCNSYESWINSSMNHW